MIDRQKNRQIDLISLDQIRLAQIGLDQIRLDGQIDWLVGQLGQLGQLVSQSVSQLVGWLRLGQVGQVRLGQVKLGQVRLSQVRLVRQLVCQFVRQMRLDQIRLRLDLHRQIDYIEI